MTLNITSILLIIFIHFKDKFSFKNKSEESETVPHPGSYSSNRYCM